MTSSYALLVASIALLISRRFLFWTFELSLSAVTGKLRILKSLSPLFFSIFDEKLSHP